MAKLNLTMAYDPPSNNISADGFDRQDCEKIYNFLRVEFPDLIPEKVFTWQEPEPAKPVINYVRPPAITDKLWGEWGRLRGEWGQGWEVWKEYGSQARAAQYLFVKRILGSPYRDSYHFNLCGQLAVCAAVGVDIRSGLSTFARIRDGYGKTILMDPQKTTHVNHLVWFFEKFRYKAIYRTDKYFGLKKFKNLIDRSRDQRLIMLVTIDPKGRISTMRKNVEIGQRSIAHWVYFIFLAADNQSVYIYNPFHNKIEAVDLDLFLESWKITAGNSSQYLYLSAERGDR